jgi:hypothetical protein
MVWILSRIYVFTLNYTNDPWFLGRSSSDIFNPPPSYQSLWFWFYASNKLNTSWFLPHIWFQYIIWVVVSCSWCKHALLPVAPKPFHESGSSLQLLEKIDKVWASSQCSQAVPHQSTTMEAKHPLCRAISTLWSPNTPLPRQDWL